MSFKEYLKEALRKTDKQKETQKDLEKSGYRAPGAWWTKDGGVIMRNKHGHKTTEKIIQRDGSVKQGKNTSDRPDKKNVKEAIENVYQLTKAQTKVRKELESQGFHIVSWMPATFNEEGQVEQTTLGALVMTKRGITKFQTVTKCIQPNGSVN